MLVNTISLRNSSWFFFFEIFCDRKERNILNLTCHQTRVDLRFDLWIWLPAQKMLHVELSSPGSKRLISSAPHPLPYSRHPIRSPISIYRNARLQQAHTKSALWLCVDVNWRAFSNLSGLAHLGPAEGEEQSGEVTAESWKSAAAAERAQ